MSDTEPSTESISSEGSPPPRGAPGGVEAAAEDPTMDSKHRAEPMVRKMLFGASTTAILQAASSGVGFLVAVVLARLLGSREYGVYVFALAWTSTLTIPAGLGLNRFVVRGVAGYEVNERWDYLRGLLIRANTLVAIASCVIAAGGVAVAVTALGQPLRWVFAAAMILIPINALTMLRQNTMQALGRIIAGQIPEYVIRPVGLVIGIALLAFVGGKLLTPLAAMIVNVVAVMMAFTAGVLALRKALPEQVRIAVPRYQMRVWMTAALPMMLIGGIWQLNGYVSTIAVGTIGGARDAGIYSAVEKGGEIIVLLLVAANMPFAPLAARMHVRGSSAGMEHAAERIAQATVIASLPIVLFFIVVPGVYLELFGTGFAPGGTALRILVLGELFNAACGPVGSVLIMTGHERAACWGVGVGLLTTVVLSVALVPSLGVTGAAVADSASFIVWNLALTLICRKRLGINTTACWWLAMRRVRTE